jgi:hypothetical protein
VVKFGTGDPMPPLPGGTGERVLARLVLEPGLSDDALVDAMRWAIRVRSHGVQCVRAAVKGYEDDPREMWEIPEVRQLCQRLVDLGVIAVLELSDFCPEHPKLQRDHREGKATPMGPGALEVWLLAKGRVTGGKTTLTADDLNAFVEDLDLAIRTCKRLTGVAPWPRPRVDRN